MLYVICKASGPDSDIYLDNDYERFIKKDGEKSLVPASDFKPKMTSKLSKSDQTSSKEIEARRRAGLERHSRSREERALASLALGRGRA